MRRRAHNQRLLRAIVLLVASAIWVCVCLWPDSQSRRPIEGRVRWLWCVFECGRALSFSWLHNQKQSRQKRSAASLRASLSQRYKIHRAITIELLGFGRGASVVGGGAAARRRRVTNCGGGGERKNILRQHINASSFDCRFLFLNSACALRHSSCVPWLSCSLLVFHAKRSADRAARHAFRCNKISLVRILHRARSSF